MGLFDWLGNFAKGGMSSLFGATKDMGQAFRGAMGTMGNIGNTIGSAVGNIGNTLGKGFGQGYQTPTKTYFPNYRNAQVPYSQYSSFVGGGGQTTGSATPQVNFNTMPQGLGGGSIDAPQGINWKDSLGKLFKGNMGKTLGGLGVIGASQLIGNPKPPALPSQYNDYMNMMMNGGTPGMQQANQYYSNVLSGNNKDAFEAATYSLDQNYAEQLRQLNSMYKTLRPGTDPTTDSTYQRDLALLNDQYSRARAQVMAGVQQGAASGMVGLGSQLTQGMANAIQPQIDLIATQWGMNADQRAALRNTLMNWGGSIMPSADTWWDKLMKSKKFEDIFG